MKFAIVCLFAIVCTACVAADSTCDPDGNGMPSCSGNSPSGNIRNNWDPTRYWVCENGVATAVLCGRGGFDPISGVCIPWSEWQWHPVCPDLE